MKNHLKLFFVPLLAISFLTGCEIEENPGNSQNNENQIVINKDDYVPPKENDSDYDEYNALGTSTYASKAIGSINFGGIPLISYASSEEEEEGKKIEINFLGDKDNNFIIISYW